MEEIWKDINGYNGAYKVSSLGRIKSLKFGRESILKPNKTKAGYLKLDLCVNSLVKTRTIHQLVAEAFLGHVPNGRTIVVNHKNFIRTDNRIENLELVTTRENSNQKHFKSSSKYTGVSWEKCTNKWKAYIFLKGRLRNLGRFENEYDAHLAYENELILINKN